MRLQQAQLGLLCKSKLKSEFHSAHLPGHVGANVMQCWVASQKRNIACARPTGRHQATVRSATRQLSMGRARATSLPGNSMTAVGNGVSHPHGLQV